MSADETPAESRRPRDVAVREAAVAANQQLGEPVDPRQLTLAETPLEQLEIDGDSRAVQHGGAR